MKKTLLFLFLSLVLLVPAYAADGTSFGEGVTLAETTSVAKILADPDAYVGKKVRIEGKVLDVCPMKGCWLELAEGEGTQSVRFQVEDDVIVFPVTAKGKLAVAEGIVEAIPMTRDRYVAWLEHQAEERGQKLDPATVGEGPFRIIQIKGTGAKIEGE
jgi:hypothetical protein